MSKFDDLLNKIIKEESTDELDLDEKDTTTLDDEDLDKDPNEDIDEVDDFSENENDTDIEDDSDNLDEDDTIEDDEEIDKHGIAQFDDLDELIEKYSEAAPTKDTLIELLNIAVIDELLATYNYLASFALAKTENRSDYIDEFIDHESDEFNHAHDLIKRIKEIGGVPLQTELVDFPSMNSNGYAWLQETTNVSDDILLNRYYEELGAIKFYGFVLSFIQKMKKAGEHDSTSYAVIRKIKAEEEEHAQDLRELLDEHSIQHDDENFGKIADDEEEFSDDDADIEETNDDFDADDSSEDDTTDSNEDFEDFEENDTSDELNDELDEEDDEDFDGIDEDEDKKNEDEDYDAFEDETEEVDDEENGK